MMLLETDSEIAPCLTGDLIAESAQEAILAARNLGDTRWASLARAWSVAFLFDRLEAIFASGEEPAIAFNRALADLSEFFNAARKSGFASLGRDGGNDFDPPNDLGSVEGVTGDHYG